MSTQGMKFHRHKCFACGHLWRHANSLKNWNSEKSHTCPKCGRVEFLIYNKSSKPLYLKET